MCVKNNNDGESSLGLTISWFYRNLLGFDTDNRYNGHIV